MDKMEVHLSKFYLGVMTIAGLMTCGIAAVIMWFIASRNFPKLIDREGITLRNGGRVHWPELTRKEKITVVAKSGSRMAGGLDLYFGKQKVKIAPQSFAEGYEVLTFLKSILGDDTEIG